MLSKKGRPYPTAREIRQAEVAEHTRYLAEKWYLRMSGQIPWQPEEKVMLNFQIELQNEKWNKLQGQIEIPTEL